jgi:hypothetical protein
MVTHKHAAGQISVRTLTAARELLHREWPGTNASVAVLLAHHQRAAALFDQIAEIDPDHHHEALVLAQQERETAQILANQMAAPSAESGTAAADKPARPGGLSYPHE